MAIQFAKEKSLQIAESSRVWQFGGQGEDDKKVSSRHLPNYHN